MEHIKTPVTVDDETLWLREPNGHFMVGSRERIAEAARAINAHDALVEALERIAKDAPTIEPEIFRGCGNEDEYAYSLAAHDHWQFAEIARAALKLARGEA